MYYPEPEQRQHISLSSFAYNIIESDNYAFTGSRTNRSGFINRIFIECYEGATPLKDAPHKEHSFKIRPSNEVTRLLYELDGTKIGRECLFPTKAALFNAILESYAKKSQYAREGIYYSETIAALENALLVSPKERRILKIDYLTAEGVRITCAVKPYKLVSDSTPTFHYLVGYSRKLSPDEQTDYRPFPFRVSRILGIKPYSRSHGSGNLTKNEQKKLQLDLDTKGVQFMLGSIEQFEVLLTPSGFNTYRSTTQIRPIADESKTRFEGENIILTFYSTRRQISHYFFKFGKDAIVISPKDLAQEFYQGYVYAASNYY